MIVWEKFSVNQKYKHLKFLQTIAKDKIISVQKVDGTYKNGRLPVLCIQQLVNGTLVLSRVTNEKI